MAEQKVKSLLKIIDALSEWVGKVISFLVVVTAFILVYDTIMRYAFNAPTLWGHQISLFLIGPYFVLGGAYTLLHRGHVSMDVIYNRFPLRMRAIVALITATLFFLFCGVLFWKALGYSWDSLTLLETTRSPPYFALYPIKLTILIAAFLLLLQGLAKFIRDLITAITGRQYEY